MFFTRSALSDIDGIYIFCACNPVLRNDTKLMRKEMPWKKTTKYEVSECVCTILITVRIQNFSIKSNDFAMRERNSDKTKRKRG